MNLSEAIDSFIEGGVQSPQEIKVFLDRLSPSNQKYFISALYFGNSLFDRRDNQNSLTDVFDKDAGDHISPQNYVEIISGKAHFLVVDYLARFRDYCKEKQINVDTL